MFISSHPKTINVHTLSLDDMDIERILDDPEPFVDQLRNLLKKNPAPPDGDTPHRKRVSRSPEQARPARTAKSPKRPIAKEPCQYCDRLIGHYWLKHHESKCPKRFNHKTTNGD